MFGRFSKDLQQTRYLPSLQVNLSAGLVFIKQITSHPIASRVLISSPSIRPIVLVLAENGGGTLKLKSRSPNGQTFEIEIRADGHRS